MPIFLTGLLTGLALIVAIGAQNAFILRQGVRKDHIGLVILICTVSDVVLISSGTLGMGALIAGRPWLLAMMKYCGGAYLLWFAFTSFRAALRPETLTIDGSTTPGRSVALTTLALTWLNPHVYLDAMVLLGSMANSHGEMRWWFTGGAITASVVWFTGLGFGARALARPLARRRVWKWLDIGIGVMMVLFALKLALG